MSGEALRARYAAVLERVTAATAAAGRAPGEVTLVAVSKLHPAADVAETAAAGQVDVGENYVQEALEKRAELQARGLCANVRWHMIGHVQSRKAAQVAGAFALVHTLDSVKLADALERHTPASGVQPVLLEINVGDEPQKAGVPVDEAAALAVHVVERCPHLSLEGLMCLPPVFDAGEAARPWFARLRRLRDSLRAECGLPLPHLSMGMSGDFEAAIAEGATIVRIGTDIFGPRPPKK